MGVEMTDKSPAASVAPAIFTGSDAGFLFENDTQVFGIKTRALGDFPDGKLGADEQLFHPV
jgi:hypothetical protein